MHQKEKAAPEGAAYKKIHLYNRIIPKQRQGIFEHTLLPAPVDVLLKLRIVPNKKNHAGFWVLTCPFHKGGKELNPSLNMHSTQGYYLCFSCGARGGDILAFYQNITGKSFIEAACDLGAWRNEYE